MIPALSKDEQEVFEHERLDELKDTLLMISNSMVLPLYFLFWIADVIYFPQFKWRFLLLRCLVIPVCFFVQIAVRKAKTYRQSEWLAIIFTSTLAAIISSMIYAIHDATTSYYAGLNLVAIGSLTFVPWSRMFFFLANALIFGPYYIMAVMQIHDKKSLIPFLVNSFFIIGTVVIAFVIRIFHDRLRINEFRTRLQLNSEIGNRDQIIIDKTAEAVRLASLSSQFSPQVVDAIRSQKINLNLGVRRARICAVFIDIVNSTERVARLDKDKVHGAISTFMNDSIKILLKYDITIDKFLGDGILAFSNDPVRYDDFAKRVISASFEIREKINSKTDFYEDNWMSPLQIKTGIAVGYANVGFYGHDRYFKSYTAIGPVVNLSNRLCGVAEPNQILISKDVMDDLDPDEFVLTPLGKVKLKGFESDVVKAYEINPKDEVTDSSAEDTDCPACSNGILQLAVDQSGLYILKCRSCGHVQISSSNSKKTHAA